jgi:tetratricopeptide (TPR) repeat protein
MAFKGSLKEASLADVAQLLALGFKTGCLSVTDRARFGQICFDRGRITFAHIVNRRDRLGDMFVRDALITHEQLRDVLDDQAGAPERRLGELLVERGLLQLDDVERYLRRQVEEAVYELFTWTRGSFYFETGHRPDLSEMLFSINAESLLLEAARRTDEWTLIEKKIPSFDLVFEADRARLADADLELSTVQRQVLPLLDGTRSVQQVMEEARLMEFDAGHALFGLVQAGLAREVGRREQGAVDHISEPSERRNLAHAFFRASMLEDAAREFRRLLDLEPHDHSARLHLGLIALRENRPLDAIRELKLLVETHGPDYHAFVNLAVALQQLEHDEEALDALDAAEKLRPETQAVALARGILAVRRLHVTEARAQLAESRRRAGPGTVPPARYYYFAALAELLAGNVDVAKGLLEDGSFAHPESTPLLLLRGLLNERKGELDAAEAAYAHVVELDATIPQAHKNLGDIAYRRGAHDHALHLYQRAAELAPALGDDLFARLGNLHYRARNRDGAIRCWKRALELNPKNEAVRNNLDIVAGARA